MPLEAAAKMRASFILLGPLLARFGRVIMSNPGGDRIGRRPVNLHVDAMRALGAEIEYRNGYYFARTLRPAARRRDRRSPGDRHGHRERDPGRDACRGPHDHQAGGPGAGGGRPDRDAPEDGRRGRAHRARTRSRSRASGGCAARSTSVLPDRIEAGTFVVAAAITGGDVTCSRRRRASTSGRSSRCCPTSACRSPAAATRSRFVPAATVRATYRARDIETAPYPGLATDLQPPTSVLLSQAAARAASTRRSSRTGSSGWPSSQRLGAEVRAARRPPRLDHRAVSAARAPRSRWATCAPAPR